MTQLELRWSLIPACVFGYLRGFKGEQSYYGPAFGSGVYCFVHSNGVRYQVYYIGQSKEVGSRLAQHYQDYTRTHPDYWLPLDASLYDGDIYEEFQKESGFAQESAKFPNQIRQRVGRQIMDKTYFAFATVEQAMLGVAEATLQFSVLKRHGLAKKGYLGEKMSQLPQEELVITQSFPNVVVEKMVTSSIPSEIRVSDGKLM